MKKDPLEPGLLQLRSNDFAEAFASFEAVCARSPELADAWYLAGLAASRLGRHGDAAWRIRQAVSRRPDNPFYHLNLGNALQADGELADAETHFRQSLALNPDFSSAHFNLANLLALGGREAEAMAEYDHALVSEPRHAGALIALARLQLERNEIPAAALLANRALAFHPGDCATQIKALEILLAAGQHALVIERCAEGLARWPVEARLFTLRGMAFGEMIRFGEAIDAFEQALQCDPDHYTTVRYLADFYAKVGDPEAGIATLAQYLSRHPGEAELFSQYLFMLNYSARTTPEEQLLAHRQWDVRHAAPVSVAAQSNRPEPGRRLRIGYASPDFRQHAVSFFIEPVLEHHDSTQFEVFLYSSTRHADATTARLKTRDVIFRDVVKLNPGEFAALVRSDRIDLLIDLAGHAGGNAMPAFALKPAPVQLTWLGYPNTTGLAAIDFRISDAVADPPGSGDRLNAEQLLRLNNGFHCYRPGAEVEPALAPPQSTNGYVTFGSFNTLAKLSDPTLAAWARILNQTPGSRLQLKAIGLADALARERLTGRLRQSGIDPARVTLSGFAPDLRAHLEAYRQIDIALDTFPYNGTTTTCDALWMGVPVVCLGGDRHAARVSASLLGALGHQDLSGLVARSEEEYVSAAVALAGNSARLTRLHQAIRPAMQASPLMDEAGFTLKLETAYRTAWRRWCDQQSIGIMAT